jgi:hypothetical protein
MAMILCNYKKKTYVENKRIHAFTFKCTCLNTVCFKSDRHFNVRHMPVERDYCDVGVKIYSHFFYKIQEDFINTLKYFLHPLYGLMVTLYNTRFNIHKFEFLPIDCISMIFMDLNTKSDYFHTH